MRLPGGDIPTLNVRERGKWMERTPQRDREVWARAWDGGMKQLEDTDSVLGAAEERERQGNGRGWQQPVAESE